MKNSFEKNYPHITSWVRDYGWIEMGQDHYSYSFVRALDEGGMVWEGREDYKTIDDALKALDAGIGEWLREQRVLA
jgi:hypothetical protein